MSDIRVHGSPLSPRVRAVLVTLIERGVTWTNPPFDLAGLKSDAYHAIHPFGRIPAFEHEGFVIYETQAITRYIDQAFAGPALHPTDPRAAARMNQTLGVIDCYAVAAVGGIIFNRVAGPMMGVPPNEAEITASLPGARHSLSALASLHAGTEFFVGDQMTLADLNLAPILSLLKRAPEGQMLLAEQASILDWLTRFEARDCMKQTHLPI